MAPLQGPPGATRGGRVQTEASTWASAFLRVQAWSAWGFPGQGHIGQFKPKEQADTEGLTPQVVGLAGNPEKGSVNLRWP